MEDNEVSSYISAELSSLGISEGSSTHRDHEIRPPTEATVRVLVQLNPENSVPSKKAMKRAARDKTRYLRRQAIFKERETRQQKAPDVDESSNSNLPVKHNDLPQLEPQPRMTRTAQKARNSAHENLMNRIYGYHDYEAKALEDALNNMQLGDAVPKGSRRRNKADARKTRKRLAEETQKANLENAADAGPSLNSDKDDARKILIRLKKEARQALLENAFGGAPSCNSTEQQKLEVSEFQRIIQSYRDLSGTPISDRLIKPVIDSALQPIQNKGLELAQAILRENSCGQNQNWGKVFDMLGKPHKKGGKFWASDYAMALMVVGEAEVSRQLNAFKNRKPGEVTLGLWARKQMLRRKFVLKLGEESRIAAKEEEQEDRAHFRENQVYMQHEGIAVDSHLTPKSIDNETLDAIEGEGVGLRVYS